MSLDYNIIEAIKLFIPVFRYNIFFSVVISTIIFILLLIINKDKKIFNYLLLGINIVIILAINHYYFKSIISFNYNNPINNMYVYFLNSIIYLILISIINFKNKKNINYIFYGIVLINLLYCLFITNYLNNIELIVIGNIFPIIIIGNILYVIYFIEKIIKLAVNYNGKRKN